VESASINDAVRPAIFVNSNVIERGIVAGAIVQPGGRLFLSGICKGMLTVEERGELELSGIVNGTLHCRGGNVHISGIAHDVHAEAGTVTISGVVHILRRGKADVTIAGGAVVAEDLSG
jgi:hypothetical protein